MLSMKSAGASGYNIRARLGGASIPVSPMTSQQIVNLLSSWHTRDGALLRFFPWKRISEECRIRTGHRHLNAAVEKRPGVFRSVKLLGHALAEHGRTDEALATYRKGIEVAEGKGDRQAPRK